MKLSTKGRYAVMALCDLAKEPGENPVVSLSAIAERQEISRPYLEQLFTKLRRAGVVASTRGAAGGYRLARPSSEMRVADIIAAVDEPIRATRCQNGSGKGCLKNGRCLTHDLWDELTRQIHLFLAAITLEDVVEGRVLGVARAPAPQSEPDRAKPDAAE